MFVMCLCMPACLRPSSQVPGLGNYKPNPDSDYSLLSHGHMLPCQRNKPQVMYLAGRDTANIGHVLPQVSLPPLWQT